MSSEIFETFIEQFSNDSDTLEHLISNLSDAESFQDSVNALLR